jgi:hypothetical protein
MYPTTYPKFIARGTPMRPGCDPSRALPRVHTYSVHMTRFSILLLYSEIFLMHQPHWSVFPDVLIISSGAFTELGHDTTRNVIAM